MPDPLAPTPAISALHQVGQRATDLDRAIAFYRDTLALPLIATFDPPGLAFFDLGNTRLLLESGAHSSILYFAVADIDAASTALRGCGVEFVDTPHLVHRDDTGTLGNAGDEEWMTFFRDPDGNTLALVERRAS